MNTGSAICFKDILYIQIQITYAYFGQEKKLKKAFYQSCYEEYVRNS